MFPRKFVSVVVATSFLFSSLAAVAAPTRTAPQAPRVESRAPHAESRAPRDSAGPKAGANEGRAPKPGGVPAEGKFYGAAPQGFRTPEGPELNAPEQRVNIALGLPQPRTESHPHAVVLSRQGFVSVYDPDRKLPLVVSWATTPKDLGPSREAWSEREDVFHEDSRLDAPQAGLADYRGSGYHRGHMVRQGERPISQNRAANQSTFSMVNIVPQSKNNNTGPWGHFEDFYRDQVFETKKVAYVQAGPILEGAAQTIGAGGVVVPSHTYKIVVLANEGVDLKTIKPEDIGASVKVFAVIIPNNDRDVRVGDHWSQYVVPVSQVAKRTNHPGFISGFSEETRKAAWNHRPDVQPTAHPDGKAFLVDGVLAKPFVPKEWQRGPKAAQAPAAAKAAVASP